MNLISLFAALSGYKTYLIGLAAIVYLIYCRHYGLQPDESVLGILGALGLGALRHGSKTDLERVFTASTSETADILPFKPAGTPVPPGERGYARLSVMLMLAGLSLLAVLCLSACTSYRHERFSDAGQPIERTTLSSPFLTKTTLQDLKTRVTEKRGTNSYTRSVGVEGVENKTDSEGVAALESLLGRLLMDGLKAAAPVPVK